MNNRRKLVIALGASTLAAPLRPFAQERGKVWRVGYIAPAGRPASIDASFHGGFPQGMRELGLVEGKSLSIEWRFAENQPNRLAALAAELAQLKVDAIVSLGTLATLAAQKATKTIPIVFIGPGDPVGGGLVKSLARPGGNTTGFSSITTEISAKRLEMLHAMVPKLSRVAVLINPDGNYAGTGLENILAAGQKLGLAMQRVEVRSPEELKDAFSRIKRDNAGGLLVTLNPLFDQVRDQIAQMSVKHRLPCMAPDQIYTEAGCLMSYGSSLTGLHRRAATYVDKIFKGANPGDLPVELPTQFELVINRKTARALGLTIPQLLLISATKVIE
jgi:putative ABC transport system substrate-binding protein